LCLLDSFKLDEELGNFIFLEDQNLDDTAESFELLIDDIVVDVKDKCVINADKQYF